MSYDINNMRRFTPPTLLQTLVVALLTLLMKMGKPFTAYTITEALRLQNPDLEIEHDKVREVVHTHMNGEGAPRLGFWRSLFENWCMEDRMWNGQLAPTWFQDPTRYAIPLPEANDDEEADDEWYDDDDDEEEFYDDDEEDYTYEQQPAIPMGDAKVLNNLRESTLPGEDDSVELEAPGFSLKLNLSKLINFGQNKTK